MFEKIPKILTRFVLPLGITAIIIYIFFRDISLQDIKTNFLKIPLFFLLLFALLSLAATLLRAFRYRLLLSRKLPLIDIFLITLVRNFSVDLLPARTASLIFYTYLTHKKGLSVEEGGSSFVLSVFYDGLALVFMLAPLLLFLDSEFPRTALYAGMGLIFLLAVVMIFFADTLVALIIKTGIMKRFPRAEKFFHNVKEYLAGHKSPSERLVIFLLSLGIRVLKYVFVFILFEGVVNIGFSMHHFALFCFGLAGTEMSSLVPIQGLAGFGTWELAFALIFGALALPVENIEAAGFVIHITTQLFEYSLGLAALLYLLLKKPPQTQ